MCRAIRDGVLQAVKNRLLPRNASFSQSQLAVSREQLGRSNLHLVRTEGRELELFLIRGTLDVAGPRRRRASASWSPLKRRATSATQEFEEYAMASSASSWDTSAVWLQSSGIPPMRSCLQQIKRSLGSSFLESTSSTRTNGLSVDPGQISCLPANFRFFAGRIFPDSTSITAMVPAGPLSSRSTAARSPESCRWNRSSRGLDLERLLQQRPCTPVSRSRPATIAREVRLRITLPS